MAALLSWSHLLALAALTTAAVPARAAIYDGDDRVPVSRRSASLYAPIGRVIGEGRAGTGFLVDACHVLTAQHNSGERRQSLGLRILFQAARGGSGRSPVASRGTIVASGNFDDTRRPSDWSEGRSRDWMLIRLDRCLGTSLGFVDLVAGQAFRFDPTDAPVRSAGFPSDRPSAGTAVLDPACRIRGGNFREWMHDCAALPGNSGSPIFQERRFDGRTRLQVVAMVTCGDHSGHARAYDGATANRATKIGYILPHIAHFLTEPAIQKGPGVASQPFLATNARSPSGGRP